MIKKYKLKNGLTILHNKRKTDSIAIGVGVRAGSNYENGKILGISHFIEHLAFDGTKNRSAEQIVKEIEDVGGEINAGTSYERTYFYIHVLAKYFDKALDLLADIILNPLFSEEFIEKERTVILDEINMRESDPKMYITELFPKTLYKKHPTKNSIAGTKETVSNITREDILNYYKKHYRAGNIVISVSGNIEKIKEKISKAFSKLEKGEEKLILINEPGNEKTEVKEKRATSNSYIALGYKVAKRNEDESYVFDVISAILFRGLSGRLANEFRIKRGWSYVYYSVYEAGIDYGYFVVLLSIEKENIEEAKKIILEQLKLNNLNEKELEEAKSHIEGDLLLKLEDNKNFANFLNDWEILGNYKDPLDYIEKIKNVSKDDVLKISKKYFDERYAFAVVEQS